MNPIFIAMEPIGENAVIILFGQVLAVN